MTKLRKPRIVSRYQIAVQGSGIRGSSRFRMVTIVELEDGRKMPMADYRKLKPEDPKGRRGREIARQRL